MIGSEAFVTAEKKGSPYLFYSVLFPTQNHPKEKGKKDAPDCFKDLNLDQVFAPILKSKEDFELESDFHTVLQDPEIIAYRQDVMRDLENGALRVLFTEFSKTVYDLGRYMNAIRKALSSMNSWDNNYLARGRLLENADEYCLSVSALAKGLPKMALRSSGLRNFAEYLSAYCASEIFDGLHARVRRLREDLSSLEYCMLIKNGTIRVRKYEGQADLSEQILATFEKFRQGNVKDYRQKLREEPHAEHVEAAVLKMLAELYKDVFADLNNFCSRYIHFEDETILRFSREVQFYLSWLDYITPLKEAGLPFHYPEFCNTTDHIFCKNGFDLALATIAREKTVPNDFRLNAPEHIIVVTGPNQGGKTTFARAFGQIHYLASLGLSVPGCKSMLYLFDQVFTHFSREEDLSTLNGKLQDDLVRFHELLSKATNKSILIINEIFASTTLSDALSLGSHMMDAISELSAPTVIVTFLDELACFGVNTISMMSTVKEEDPTERTFRIVRKPPDGLAYAMSIAEKHGLTYEQLIRKLK